MKVVYTAGVWDNLHRGHLNILAESRKLGDVLVVGVVSDEGTRAYKGQYPEEPEEVRFRNLRECGIAHVVVAQKGTDPTDNLERFRPEVMTHGDDWQELREGKDTLERLGVEWVLLRYTRGISSTELRGKVQTMGATL